MKIKNEPNVNFSKAINYLVDTNTKVFFSTLYYPFASCYGSFESEYDKCKKFEIKNPEEHDQIMAKILEVIENFDSVALKRFLNDSIVEMCSNLLDDTIDDESYFNKNHTEYKKIIAKYSYSQQSVQNLRNQLLSFFRIISNDLSELERAGKNMEAIYERSLDNMFNIKNAWTGALIGMAIGSFLFPVVGTIIGLFGGIYYVNHDAKTKSYSKFIIEFDKYSDLAYRIIELLGTNSKELYMILNKSIGTEFKRNIKGLYFEIKKTGGDADSIITDFLKFEINELNKYMDMEGDEDNPIILNEYIKYVEHFVIRFNKEKMTESNHAML